MPMAHVLPCSCGCFPASMCIMHWLCMQQLVLTYLDLAFSASFWSMYCLHAALDGSLRPLKPGCMQVGQPFWLPLHLMQPNGPLCTAFFFLDSVVLAFAWAAAGLFMPEGWAADGLFMACFLVKFWYASCSYCSNVFLGWSYRNMEASKLQNSTLNPHTSPYISSKPLNCKHPTCHA